MIITIAEHSYLESHRFFSVPYMPMVMFVDLIWKERIRRFPFTIDRLEVFKPLMFKKNRDQELEIKGEGNRVELWSNDHKLVESKLGEPKQDFDPIDIDKDFYVNMPIDQIYPEILPHGEHFHNHFEYTKDGKRVIGHIESCFDGEFFSSDKTPSLQPTILDGLLQACAYYIMTETNHNALPRGIEGLTIHDGSFRLQKEVYFDFTEVGEDAFRCFLCDEAGKVFVSIEKLIYTRLNSFWKK